LSSVGLGIVKGTWGNVEEKVNACSSSPSITWPPQDIQKGHLPVMMMALTDVLLLCVPVAMGARGSAGWSSFSRSAR